MQFNQFANVVGKVDTHGLFDSEVVVDVEGAEPITVTGVNFDRDAKVLHILTSDVQATDTDTADTED